MNAYTYDSANRLTSISGGQTATYAYIIPIGDNGLGYRLSQNGVNYTLDLNAGLTQVLNESAPQGYGTNTYLYGVGRIAQVNTTTDYFMTDALGSVRQLTDAQGDITLANAYNPYGKLAQTAGGAQTSYGFTGEFTDPSGMVYLRARYYMPNDGRFLTRDTWMGDYNSPLSLNRWMYVEGNPVNYSDPSGHTALGQNPCDGQPNYEICYARWIVSNGGELTEDIIKSIYNRYPDETLQLIQQQFDIKLPAGYSFRQSSGGSIWGPDYEGTWGANWWFTEYNQMGDIFEISEHNCSLLSTSIPIEAIHIDYSLYITRHTFTDWNYNPDDIGGIMIHEAVHAWQESVTRTYIVVPGLAGGPSSLAWFDKYQAGIERQAVDITLNADSTGRIDISSRFQSTLERYRGRFDGLFGLFQGPDFPYSLPANVP